MTPLFEEVGRATLWSGRFFSVEELRMRSPSGREFAREVVRHPGAVGMVALEGDQAVLIEEFRAPVGRVLLQIPAGKLNRGEEPLACARREMVEEIGMAAARWTHLSTFTTTPGFSDEMFHLFLAEDLSVVDADPQGEEEEAMGRVRVPLDDVPAMIADGRIADAKTIIGLLLARERRRH